MKPLRTQSFTAYVGLDWADTKHDICLQEAGSQQREFACVAHQVECIDEWAKSLQQRFGGPIAIALELAKGPIVYALQKYVFLVLFPINPLTRAKYREAFKPDRERFKRAEELQKYAGIAPVTERSGKKRWVHWRWQCPTFLRQTFVECAGQTINKSFWARAWRRSK